MSNIYLSWSFIQLIVTLIVIAFSTIAIIIHFKYKKKPEYFKYALTTGGGLVIITLITAFDVGIRQGQLDRARFDVQVGEVSQKVESDRKTVNDVKQSFDKSINESK